MKQSKKLLGILVGATLVLAACGDDADEDSSVVEETTSSVATTPFVDADDVLLAGLLLTIGDIDRAIAEGLVNPAEVDAAIASLESGTMSDWLAGEED